MSRSFKKNPVTGITSALSEKEDKRNCNRTIRRKNRQINFTNDDVYRFVEKREVMNIWLMDKDGKMRFDPKKHPKLMRK